MARYIQISTTAPSKEEAEKIASMLVGAKLAACVQVIGPVISTYWWEGKIETAQEWLCIIKSRTPLYREIQAAIKKHHPYQVPEILATPVLKGSRDYLTWVRNTTRT